MAKAHTPHPHHLSGAQQQWGNPLPPWPSLPPGWDGAFWDDATTIPVSGRPCPEVTEKPKAPWGGRCSSSWLVPSGKSSTTRPTARSCPGAPMSSTLSERCGPEPPFLWGEGTRKAAGASGCAGPPQQPRTAFLGTAGMCQAPSYLSAVLWGRR